MDRLISYNCLKMVPMDRASGEYLTPDIKKCFKLSYNLELGFNALKQSALNAYKLSFSFGGRLVLKLAVLSFPLADMRGRVGCFRTSKAH
jgi:hypothetical protein